MRLFTISILLIFLVSCSNNQEYRNNCEVFYNSVLEKDLDAAQSVAKKMNVKKCYSSGYPIIISILYLKKKHGYTVKKKYEILKWLLENFKIDPNYQRNQEGLEGVRGIFGQFIISDSQSPLKEAVLHFGDDERPVDINIIKLLIDKGADVNIRTLNKNSTPILVSIGKDFELFKLLIDSGADPNIENHQGISACKAIAFEKLKEYHDYLVKKEIKCSVEE